MKQYDKMWMKIKYSVFLFTIKCDTKKSKKLILKNVYFNTIIKIKYIRDSTVFPLLIVLTSWKLFNNFLLFIHLSLHFSLILLFYESPPAVKITKFYIGHIVLLRQANSSFLYPSFFFLFFYINILNVYDTQHIFFLYFIFFDLHFILYTVFVNYELNLSIHVYKINKSCISTF